MLGQNPASPHPTPPKKNERDTAVISVPVSQRQTGSTAGNIVLVSGVREPILRYMIKGRVEKHFNSCVDICPSRWSFPILLHVGFAPWLSPGYSVCKQKLVSAKWWWCQQEVVWIALMCHKMRPYSSISFQKPKREACSTCTTNTPQSSNTGNCHSPGKPKGQDDQMWCLGWYFGIHYELLDDIKDEADWNKNWASDDKVSLLVH